MIDILLTHQRLEVYLMKNIQPTQTAKKSFDTTYIRYDLTALIIFGSPFLPPIDPITPMGMAVLGTFLGALYG